MRFILEKILEILFPSKCLGCKSIRSSLCESCLSKISRGPEITSEGVIALFPYRTPLIQQSLWRLKYRQKKHIAEVFGRHLYAQIVEELGEDEVAWRPGETERWLIVPIPGSKKRINEKGYNQAGELGKAVCKYDTGNFLDYRDDLLLKIKETPSQVSMKTRTARLSNIVESLGVASPEAVRDRGCIVIDDITTTGATMKEARRVLLRAGARSVLMIAVAA